MIINSLFIFFVITLVVFATKKQYVLNKKNTFHNALLIAMLVMHFSVTIIQYKWSFTSHFDSNLFYTRAVSSTSWFSLFKTGNSAMSFLCFPFTKLGLSYFSVSLLFSFFSYLGYLIYFRIITKKIVAGVSWKLMLIIFFLFPSIHFWTGFLTKESLLFLILALFYQQLNKYKSVTLPVLLGIMCTLLIRPYLALIVLGVLGVIYFNSFSKCYKIASAFVGALSVYLLIKFLKIRSFDSFQDNYNNLIKYANRAGNSSIDLGDSNFAERMLLVLFRPFFIDAKTVLQFFVSFENLIILLLLVGAVVLNKYLVAILNHKVSRFLVFYIIILVVFYSIYMYNMGLANRMRVMFVPYFFILIFNLLKQKSAGYN